jgi:hypothetical protein
VHTGDLAQSLASESPSTPVVLPCYLRRQQARKEDRPPDLPIQKGLEDITGNFRNKVVKT